MYATKNLICVPDLTGFAHRGAGMGIKLSRKEAKAKNLKTYFTGIPCNNNHISERYTCGGCVVCVKQTAKKNDHKAKLKLRLRTQEVLKSISRICKRRLCDIVFTPKIRKDQVFCSERCASIQGKEDWKNRNRDKVRITQNKRKNIRYKTEPKYAEKQKIRSNKRYHDLTDEEKFIRNKNNRLKENKTNKRIYMRNYHKYRNKYDIVFKITNVLRARVREAIKNKGGIKSFKTMKLINCSVSKCMKHLEKQFTKGMSWANYGKWHIDHIKPCASFDLRKVSEQKKCFNYKNLQPMWAVDNLRKGSKII